MYEADRIKSISDIPDNISNLLTELKEYKEDFNIEIEYCKDNYKITLHESNVNRGLNTIRCILMEISENPCSYSIHLFNNEVQNSSNKELKKIYDIEVEGENDFRLIKQDVKDLIEGKKGASFSSNYPL
ncbi:MAG: hypothetical protein HWN80_02825 [Candidatus Lokiarchaeota archaeon]|nr:hypothetical protein [Candidatus Lokiarchaeota archaeon]